MSFDPITYALCRGGGLPVVKLTTDLPIGTAVFSEADCVSLESASASGLPAVMKFPINGMTAAMILDYTEGEVEGVLTKTYQTALFGIEFTFMGVNGVWESVIYAG